MTASRETHALFELLVAEATMAASSHNTQPWRFEIGADRIRILPDFARRCSVVDPDDHHLYASLGCAAENMVQAAATRGWHAVIEVRSSGNAYTVEALLKPGAPVTSPLADAIASRQCTRTGYDGRQVSGDELALLEQAASGAGVAPILITEEAKLETVAHWVEAGRCYERFALQATALGIRNAVINPPVEVDTLRTQFAAWLGVGPKRPELVVRFGYGPGMPKSLRRPVEAVLGAASQKESSHRA